MAFLMQGGHKPGKPGILREFSEPGKHKNYQRILCKFRGKL